MVKGVSRRVIVVKSPDRHIFEEAIFIVREDTLRTGGVTEQSVVREAQEVADSFIRTNLRKRGLKKLPAPVYTLFGAAITGAVWLCTSLF